MKKYLFLTTLLVFTLACSTLTGTFSSTPTEAPTDTASAPTVGDGIEAKLAELGGVACDENPDFTCVTITVPLDHFDAANTKTIDVVFAVSPATGERKGMFVQAFPGGPGGEGISTGGLAWF